jgi:S-adenosylmethionine synthetase
MLKTAECVSPAHPDKMCDQISDLILTECLKQDPLSRVAIETLGGHGHVYVVGELTTNAYVDIQSCVRKVLSDNRYNPDDYNVSINIVQQSQNIAQGVDTGGAGDQGIMVGYATRETPELMPLEIMASRRILQALWDTFPLHARDSKSQVTVCDGVIKSIVISAEGISRDILITFILGLYPLVEKIYANEAGEWDNG